MKHVLHFTVLYITLHYYYSVIILSTFLVEIEDLFAIVFIASQVSIINTSVWLSYVNEVQVIVIVSIQELVSLLLTGEAVSNVFNGVMSLDTGTGEIMPLRGISARSDIGFLSLFEHYGSCEACLYSYQYATQVFRVYDLGRVLHL